MALCSIVMKSSEVASSTLANTRTFGRGLLSDVYHSSSGKTNEVSTFFITGCSLSSTIKGKPKVSHIGVKLLKADLSQAVKSAVVWDREMKMYYERKIKEGKAYGVVLNAVKFKLVCRMFAVVRRGTPFVDLQTYKN